ERSAPRAPPRALLLRAHGGEGSVGAAEDPGRARRLRGLRAPHRGERPCVAPRRVTEEERPDRGDDPGGRDLRGERRAREVPDLRRARWQGRGARRRIEPAVRYVPTRAGDAILA